MPNPIVTHSDLSGALPLVARGKVRDLYQIDDRTLLFVATDRISAYDVIMENVAYLRVLFAFLRSCALTCTVGYSQQGYHFDPALGALVRRSHPERSKSPHTLPLPRPTILHPTRTPQAASEQKHASPKFPHLPN